MSDSSRGTALVAAVERKRVPEWRKTLKRFLKVRLVPIGLAILLVMLVMAIFSEFVAPQGYEDAVFTDSLESPSSKYWFGTDHIGRDMFSRIVFGARLSMVVSLTAISISLSVGITIGITAGYFGRWVDTLLMRIVEIIQAFPFIIFALVLVAAMGSKIQNVVIAIAIVFIPGVSRVIRSEALSVTNRDYVTASRAIGASAGRIMLYHVLPQVIAPAIVIASLEIAGAVLLESTLSFLGMGIPPPFPSWGGMLRIGYPYMQTAPWLAIVPGAAITLLVISVNFVGDGLRDALDPRQRR